MVNHTDTRNPTRVGLCASRRASGGHDAGFGVEPLWDPHKRGQRCRPSRRMFEAQSLRQEGSAGPVSWLAVRWEDPIGFADLFLGTILLQFGT